MVKLYRNYDPATSDTPVQMVSAYRGLNDIIRLSRGSGVVVNWKQAGRFLHISGDTRAMYIWDTHTETQLLDLSTRELGEAGDDAACQRRTAQHVVPLVRSAFICGERSGQHHVRCHA